jgi:DNA-binding GntR family transcriptional regulator
VATVLKTDPDPVPPLRRSSTADEVASLLRGRIVSGDLPPGTQLREVSLAGAIGVSRPTLREAMQALKGEGLVRHEPHRGMFVAALGPEEIEDIYQVRRVLEGSAAAAATKASEAGLEHVRRAYERLTDVWGTGDAVIIDADLRLHQEIVALLDSPRLDALFDSVAAALRPCLALLSHEMRSTVLHAGSLEEHAAIVDAITDRKGRLAQKLVTAHIDANRQRLLTLVGAPS